MRVLAVSSAYGGADAAILEDGHLLAAARAADLRGLPGTLPGLLKDMLDRAGRTIGLVAVSVGPGSFTGLRTGIALASGIALGLGVPIVGVTVAEALAKAVSVLDGRTLWTAIEARRGRFFLDAGSGAVGVPADALPHAEGRVAVCGNAANAVAAILAARGTDVMLTSARLPRPEHVAAVGVQRAHGERPALAARPLYVDEAAVRLPAGGRRAAPG
jgi:tRNA threonylcarbamoyladenosine biosynthesis protein TsaB